MVKVSMETILSKQTKEDWKRTTEAYKVQEECLSCGKLNNKFFFIS